MARPPDRILDELLVLRCREGDVEAFEKLVSRWHGRLRRHAWLLTQDPEATRDVVQDAWLDMIRTFRRLKDPASFGGWAYRIVGNKAADWARQKKRQRALRSEIAYRKRNLRGNSAADESRNNVQSVVRDGIRLLPADDQLVLFMKYVDGMSTREIAGTLGIPVGTVKSRLHHARERLKRIMQRNDQ